MNCRICGKREVVNYFKEICTNCWPEKIDPIIVWKQCLKYYSESQNELHKEYGYKGGYQNGYAVAKYKGLRNIYVSARRIQTFFKRYRKTLKRQSATLALNELRTLANETEKSMEDCKKKLKIALLKTESRCVIPDETGRTEIIMKDNVPILEEIQKIRKQFNI
jgi:hypothetical protein